MGHTEPAVKTDRDFTLDDMYKLALMNDPPKWARNIRINLPGDGKPSRFQVHDLNRLMRNSRWGLFSDMGCGKTLPAQAYAIYMAAHDYRVVAVMPPVLTTQFKNSLFRVFEGTSELLNLHVLNERPVPAKISKTRARGYRKHLARYPDQPLEDITAKDLDTVRNMSKIREIYFTRREVGDIRRSTAKAKELATEYSVKPGVISNIRNKVFREDLFERWDGMGTWPDILIMSYRMFQSVANIIEPHYPVVIADEAHYLCHPTSKIHRKFRWYIEKGDKAFVAMTGTPAPNVPTDCYGLIKLINSKAYENYTTFKAIHEDSTIVETQTRRFEVVDGYLNLDLLASNLYAYGSRVTKEEVLDLKSPQIIEEDLELDPQHMGLYRKLVKERLLVNQDKETFSASESQQLLMKAMQIVLNPDIYVDTKISRNVVKEWLEEKLEAMRCKDVNKVVVFANFTKSIEKIVSWFPELRPAVVYGKADKVPNVKRFVEDPNCRLMVAHPKAGGVGIDGLQSVCCNVIFIEPTSVPGDFQQALDRMVRRGQDHVVLCYILKVLRTPWPERVDNMRKKMKLVSDVTLDKSALIDQLLAEN